MQGFQMKYLISQLEFEQWKEIRKFHLESKNIAEDD